jgi:branched-chain amino acid transport system permease protein
MSSSESALRQPVVTTSVSGGAFPRVGDILTFLAVAVLILSLPWLHPSYRLLSFAVCAGISGIVLYGLAIPFGQAGILSLGYAGLMGMGAYTAAILSRDAGMGLWEAMPFSALVAALFAGLFGLPSLRVSGHHFAIVTYISCELLRIALINGGAFTGAATGIDLPAIGKFGVFNMDKFANTYLLVAVLLLVSMLVAYYVRQSRYGRTLRAIRDNEPLARGIGIDANRYKLGAFMLSGLFAGVAGDLQAYNLRHISPDLYGGSVSISLALMAMLGGARTQYGPLIGAVVVSLLPEVMNLDPVDSRIAYGLALILVIMLTPAGLKSAGKRYLNRMLRR